MGESDDLFKSLKPFLIVGRIIGIIPYSGDRYFKRDITLITILILTSAIGENGVLHLKYIKAFDDISGNLHKNSTEKESVLETYYRRSHNHWAKKLGYHEIFVVLAFLQHKCMLYAYNYLDIMLAVFSRAIYFKFKMLYKLANEHLVKPLRNGVTHSKNGHAWLQVAQDHKKLCDLLQRFENFFSPLVFGSYAVNVYYICIQVSRLDQRVSSGHDIGLSGLGCFVVTKPFMLSLLSVIFTLEIVLLQSAPSPTPVTTCCCPIQLF
ncbi:unnamed protein product [Orchesella dallaii]|uniref:Uncharacterized protein n=1 Tax=Orchesella dallaii TaxID=48710 RepID=A0ABP1R1M0_9HEXA